MVNHEFDPQRKVDQAETKEPSLIEELLHRLQERNEPLQVREQTPEEAARSADAFLPQFDLLNGTSQFRRGNEMSSPELAKESIKSKHRVDRNGIDSTLAEYPNGLQVLVVEGEKRVKADGTRIELDPTTVIQFSKPNRAHPRGSGILVDGNGRQIAKQNDDGSVTVATDEGFFTQTPYGITRVTAIRSRDGKSWTVLNTDDPLGDLRPTPIPNEKPRNRK